MQSLVEAAPRLMDYLGDESLRHFQGLCGALDAAGQAYRVNHRLVRGMDYYSLTVFEWITDRLGAQGTVCGGGRYDGLMELVGGKPERVLDLVQQSGHAPPPPVPDVYAVVPDAAALPVAVQVSEALRAAGVAVLMHAGAGSMKAQFKRADASGARWALVFGGSELAQGVVAVKPLRDDAAPQVTRPLADVAAWAAELLHR